MVGYAERYYEWVRRLRRQRRAIFIFNMLAALGSRDEPDPLPSPIIILSNTQVAQLPERMGLLAGFTQL